MTDLLSDANGAAKPNPYGVVDTEHSHASFIDLAFGEEGWNAFQWPVALLADVNRPNILKQMTCCQNARRPEQYFVKKTLFDALNALKKILPGYRAKEVKRLLHNKWFARSTVLCMCQKVR